MKNSKLVFALSLLFMFSFNSIQAQSKPKLSDEQKEAVVAQLKADKERLALTKEQEEPFMEISKKYLLQMKDLKQSDENRMEKFKALKEIQSQKNEEMKTLLNESQYVTYLDIQKERRAKLKDRRNQ